MTRRRSPLECLHCAVLLTEDDQQHYGYACHPCALREHDLILVWRGAPDHPDCEHLHRGPVDLGLRPRPAHPRGAHR